MMFTLGALAAGFVFNIVCAIGLGVIAWLLWNFSVVPIFKLPMVSYTQAVGLLYLVWLAMSPPKLSLK